VDPEEENAGCDGEGRQLQFDCFSCRNGLEHGDTGRDMFFLASIRMLQEMTVDVTQSCDGWVETWSQNVRRLQHSTWRLCRMKDEQWKTL
jgi:hypothetical protein